MITPYCFAVIYLSCHSNGGGGESMKKVPAIVLSLMLFVVFAFGCQKADTPKAPEKSEPTKTAEKTDSAKAAEKKANSDQIDRLFTH